MPLVIRGKQKDDPHGEYWYFFPTFWGWRDKIPLKDSTNVYDCVRVWDIETAITLANKPDSPQIELIEVVQHPEKE